MASLAGGRLSRDGIGTFSVHFDPSSCMNSLPIPCRALLTGALLAVLLPRAARAEDAISYKYEDYREMGGRVAIRTQEIGRAHV